MILGFHLCDWFANTRHMLLDRGMMGDGVADLKSLRKSVEDAGRNGDCEVMIFFAYDWWQRGPDQVLDVVVERFRMVCQDLPVGGCLPRGSGVAVSSPCPYVRFRLAAVKQAFADRQGT